MYCQYMIVRWYWVVWRGEPWWPSWQAFRLSPCLQHGGLVPPLSSSELGGLSFSLGFLPCPLLHVALPTKALNVFPHKQAHELARPTLHANGDEVPLPLVIPDIVC